MPKKRKGKYIIKKTYMYSFRCRWRTNIYSSIVVRAGVILAIPTHIILAAVPSISAKYHDSKICTHKKKNSDESSWQYKEINKKSAHNLSIGLLIISRKRKPILNKGAFILNTDCAVESVVFWREEMLHNTVEPYIAKFEPIKHLRLNIICL